MLNLDFLSDYNFMSNGNLGVIDLVMKMELSNFIFNVVERNKLT